MIKKIRHFPQNFKSVEPFLSDSLIKVLNSFYYIFQGDIFLNQIFKVNFNYIIGNGRCVKLSNDLKEFNLINVPYKKNISICPVAITYKNKYQILENIYLK